MKSSLEYWKDRWAAAPRDFNGSWPDYNARHLEAIFLARVIPPTQFAAHILDLGCGNGQLFEFPDLRSVLASRSYLGLDGSSVAVAAARDLLRCVGPTLNLNWRVEKHDFTEPLPVIGSLCEGHFLISKRVLQNIHPDSRAPVLDWIRQNMPHGVLIEGTEEGYSAINARRAEVNLAPLLPLPFNFPLTREEITSMNVQCHPFMGYYNQVSRAWDNVPPDAADQAYALSLEAISAGKVQPAIGPIMGFTW